MKTLLLVVLFVFCGCEDIAPKYLTVKIISIESELAVEIGGEPAIRQAYSIVEDEEGKRYFIRGKVGLVGDTFKMDVSLMNEIGG
jgi:hypothetical protein